MKLITKVYEQAAAAAFLTSTGWTALISVLTISVFCFIVILIAVVFYKKYRKDRNVTDMVGITTPVRLQKNISPETDGTRDTDMQVVDGLETTAKGVSISELDLNVLHALNSFNKQDRLKMAATNGGKVGEDLEFQIDPNLVSAFMFGGDTDGFGEEYQETGNPFRDSFGFGDGVDDNYHENPFGNPDDDDDEEEANQLQQADSMDGMNVLQQRMKLMRLLQQQYELMNDYNMDIEHGGQDDVNVDMGYF